MLFHNLPARQRMIAHLQQRCHLRTSHLRPEERNVTVQCHDLSAQNANQTYACGGYLNLTVSPSSHCPPRIPIPTQVRQYFYAKHGLKLKHPYLPCMIVFGGGAHISYFP